MDLLLGDSTMSRQTEDILKRFASKNNKIFARENLERQFILTGATLPNKIKRISANEFFNNWFVDPVFIKSEEFHKIPKTITF